MNTENQRQDDYHNYNNSADKFYYSSYDSLHPVSILEVQTNKNKRLWLKVIAFFVAFVFLFQQLGIADIYSYRRVGGVAEEVLPSSNEYDQQGRMGPQHLQNAQRKHEEIIRQRMGKEDLMGQLIRKPKEEEEDMPLKKKQSGGGGGGGAVNYTMTEPDDIDDPHNFNDLIHDEATSVLQQIDTYDITRHPEIDLNYWKDKAEEKTDEKTGLKYWVGYEEEKKPDEMRKIKEAVYFGDKEQEKIQKVYSGYVEDPATGEYKPKFRTDYEYDGDSIRKMTKYYIWDADDSSVKVEESYFEGSEDNNKIAWRINYDKDTKEATSAQYFHYGDGEESDTSQAMRETRSYETKDVILDLDGDGTISPEELEKAILEDKNAVLINVTYFVGEKDHEVADYSINLDTDGDITSTTINYYRGGNRADDADYRDPKEKSVSYRGEMDAADLGVDANADGIFEGYDTDGDGAIDIWCIDSDGDGAIDGYDIDGDGAIDAEGKLIDYAIDVDGDWIIDGFDLDGDGTIDIVYDGKSQVTSISYYHMTHRLPGEEVLDFTETYARGNIIQTSVYYYGESELRASEANYRDPMKTSVTYWGEADTNNDGQISQDEIDNAREKSATYYYIEARLKGEETADYTVRRTTDGTVASTMIYYYEGDKRAADSEATDKMAKNVTYRGPIDTTAEDIYVQDFDNNTIQVLTGCQDKLASITVFDYEGREKGKEISDYTAKYNTKLQVVSTTINLYETELKRAKVAGSSDRMSRTVTYRRWVDPLDDVDLVDLDGNPGKDGVTDAFVGQLDSITYFHFDGREKGEEVSNFTEKFNSDQDVTSTTVYLYEENLIFAPDAGPYDRMSRSVTYRGELTKVPGDPQSLVTTDLLQLDGSAGGDGVIDAHAGQLASISYYDFADRMKGDEVSDYTEKYNSNLSVVNTTVYYYEDNKRAKVSGSTDRMSRSVVYRGELADPQAPDGDSDGIIDDYSTRVASITYYDYLTRLKGEEITDYTEKYNSRLEVASTTVYLYEADLNRAADAESFDRMSRSVTYRFGIDPAATVDADGILEGMYDSDGDGTPDTLYKDKLASITYYDYDARLKGEEVTDYTEKYNSKQQVVNTTVYLYEADLRRAIEAGSNDRMARSVTYRGEVDTTVEDLNDNGILDAGEDLDGDGILDGIDANSDGILDNYADKLASITYYDFANRLKGEEVTDYTEKFNSNQNVVNTTVYLYESDLKRASAAGADDRMSRSVSYRGELDQPQAADADNNGLIDLYEDKLASVTFYDFLTRIKGEEVTDYTEKYNSKQEVVTTTVYLYESDLIRANVAGSDDRMARSVTYRGELAQPQAADADKNGLIDLYEDKLASITYYDYAARLKGEEVTDYTEKFNSRQEVVTTTVYLYEDALDRASAAGADDRMSRSVTYRGELDQPQAVDANKDGLIDVYENKLASITYYDYVTRLKGEEITDYTEKFNSDQQVTNTTVYLYEADLKRAQAASADDRMARSVTYRGELAQPQAADGDNNGLIDLYEDMLLSITYYDFESRLKGEEVTDYTEKFNSRQEIVNTTVYLYEDTLSRAQAAGSEDRMSQSVTYRGELQAMPDGAIDSDNDGIIDGFDLDEDGTIDVLLQGALASITYYDYATRLKGEEVTDYTEKYDSGGGVTNTTVYLYESDLRRASAAGSDDRMSESVTYRGEVDTTIADTNNDGLIDGYEDKVASITYYDYADRLKGEEVTDYSENYNSKNVLTQTTVYIYEDDLRRAKDADAT
ncbi:MAG: VCBS repeat-containing protein, partial [Candidatus Omnitrophota bacterium]